MTKLSDFDLDLAVGQEGEALVEQLLTGGTTVEVKTDLKWKDTGNLYIEYYSRSKDRFEMERYWQPIHRNSLLVTQQRELVSIRIVQY